MKRLLLIVALLPVLAGCDQLKERMGIPDPARIEAEGKAIGGACRHAGRGVEDCYRLNPRADKPAVFAGWKEMNEYMIKNNMQAMPPELQGDTAGGHKKAAEGEGAAKGAPAGEAKGQDKPAASH